MKLAITNNKVCQDKIKDINRIVEVMASYQILLTSDTATLAWATYSETKEVEWIELPESDEEIYLGIIDYLNVADL